MKHARVRAHTHTHTHARTRARARTGLKPSSLRYLFKVRTPNPGTKEEEIQDC